MARMFVTMVGAAALTGVLAALPAPAMAQYPDRPIKMIVPWAAGGDTDNIFRPFAIELQKQIGQPVVVANIGGASGTVGAREAKAAAPDGYTIYAVHDYIHLTYYAGISDVKYSDFEPVCLVSATSHIFPAMIEKAAGIKFKFVSYDGLAPRMNALLGGHINLTDANLTQKGKVEAAVLRFIAIASEKRDPESPDVPTLKELGMNIVYEVARGILVPKGTPEPVRAKLEEGCAKATKEPSFAQAMKAQGTRVAFLNAADYAKFLAKIDAENKVVMTDLGLIKK
jgi:tripartite-type tricarboxylate transporter receptor subunit TctC